MGIEFETIDELAERIRDAMEPSCGVREGDRVVFCDEAVEPSSFCACRELAKAIFEASDSLLGEVDVA